MRATPLGVGAPRRFVFSGASKRFMLKLESASGEPKRQNKSKRGVTQENGDVCEPGRGPVAHKEGPNQ